ncbi:hypothetical protein W02_24960 [Nitrospira sp. KM1]|uniref:hypothetical protein n=1 Tax=Nitrospira sp. KM1 TaxID=1936990 RepID=UPI0013A792CE|nr:hypothetical protein [Nitrospira sp. KM1]BCA55356.1 hypothetical protein W02_24960 [Nitrospira sp. KM1]
MVVAPSPGCCSQRFRPATGGLGGSCEDEFVSPPGKFLVHVTVPEGYLNGSHKTEIHAAINQAVLEATAVAAPAGIPPATEASVLVVIDEVPEGNGVPAGRPSR